MHPPHEATTEQSKQALIDRIKASLQSAPGRGVAGTVRQVLLFSGHMIDPPGRTPPRFPARSEPIAARAIAQALERLGAGPDDLAFSQAAAGGDLLFLEACQQRGVPCRVLLPFQEHEFIEKSILPSADGEDWRARFEAVQQRLQEPVRVMGEVLGPLPQGANPFEACNLWLLYSALAYGADKLTFIALWDGGGGRGPGGTRHMYEEVAQLDGRVIWLDTRRLW
jgi:hypothetical protein